MKDKQQDHMLESEKVTKLIRKFSVPAIAASLVGSVYNIVDQIFIGQKLGAAGNAATNIAFPLVMLMVTFAMVIGTGGASNFSIFMGSGEKEKAEKTVGNSLLCMIISGIVLAIFAMIFLKPLLYFFGAREHILKLAYEYTQITVIGIPFYVIGSGFSMFIRADGKPKYAMITTMSGAVLNTIFDPIFIFICGWGIKGAALATIIGQIVGAILALYYVKKFESCKITKETFKPDFHIIKNVIVLGIPSGITQITVMAVQIVMNNVLGFYGAKTAYGQEIPLACAGIISKVSSVFTSVIFGISQSCQPIFGHNYGAKNYQRVKDTYKTAAKIVTVVAVVAFILFQTCPVPILKVFGSSDPLYLEFGSRYLRIYLLFMFINGIQILTSNYFPAIGKAKQGIILSLSRQAILQLPLIVILPMIFGINGVLYAGPISDGIAGILAIVLVMMQMKKMKA